MEKPESPSFPRYSKKERFPPRWRKLRASLAFYAETSGIPQVERELAVDRILGLYLQKWVQGSIPEKPGPWCRKTLCRYLGKLRERRTRIFLHVEFVSAQTAQQRLASLPMGTGEFWDWMSQHRVELEKLLTKNQWEALINTRDAPTIAEAAKRAGQSRRDYRIHLKRAARKIGEKFFKIFAPPPPL